ncbi:MAG: methyltransferase domain-containing protein [Candidatus Promineofilum sp.]|nr:methyltransferase domain-containing protein [Promineifilum sp.]
MDADRLDLLSSPCCHAALTLQEPAVEFGEVWRGRLVCARCGAAYPIRRGMPHLYVEDARWQPKAREAAGWVAFHKRRGIYDVVADAIDLRIPYYPEEPWLGVARSFDAGVRLLGPLGPATVLDLGAGRGWAAKQFARRGSRVVALDVADDDNVGLGRARALMDDAGVTFERVIGDGENLPLADGRFDLVFCAAALHHFSDLPELFRQIARVLRPGGRLLAVREPSLSIAADEAATLDQVAGEELAAGINENNPTLVDYLDALDGAGLRLLRATTPDLVALSDGALTNHGRHVGALRPSPVASMADQRMYWGTRWRAARLGRLGVARRALRPFAGRARLELAHLLWAGGEMILLAQKPA